MKRFTRRTLVVGTIVLAVVVGAGTAIAASGDSATSPSAFLDSLAQHLGVSREKLDDAARAAALDQVEAALDAGTITKEQADELKERVESGDVPVFGLGLGRGFGPGFGHGPGVRGPGRSSRRRSRVSRADGGRSYVAGSPTARRWRRSPRRRASRWTG